MRLLGIIDLAKRWNYTKQGVHQKMQRDQDFPKAIATINKATLVFNEEDVIKYEQQRKELQDSKYKHRFFNAGFYSFE